MRRPTGWLPNPQALATVSKRREYDGHPHLGKYVDTDTWLTPLHILRELGSFDLDPCAAEVNPTWTRSANYFTKPDNGLDRVWTGRVFMNPPFSDTTPWLRKHSQHQSGISLVPSAVESRAWREFVWPKSKAILLLHGRMRFCNPDGSMTTGRPLRSIALIAWSESDAAILRGCMLAGTLLHGWRVQP